jgi:hypothetical protein
MWLIGLSVHGNVNVRYLGTVRSNELNGVDLAILLLKERRCENTTFICAHYVKGVVRGARCHLLIGVEEAELVRFVAIVHQDRVE